MGFLTLSELRDELRLGLLNRTELSDAQLDRWINQAYFHLTLPSVFRHLEVQAEHTIALVADTNVYSLSDATVGFHIVDIDAVTYYDTTGTPKDSDNHWQVRPQELHWFRKRQHPTGSEGPRHYLWHQDQVRLSPIPDSAVAGRPVVIDLWREPARLTQDTDTTVLGNYWDRALFLGARWFAFDSLQYGDLALSARQEYAAYINEASDERQTRESHFTQEIHNEPYQPSF